MAGGGVPEAMAIGALMGAGTGGIMAAAQDKDPLQGALLGAVTGAATGGIGAGAGGAATSAAENLGAQAIEKGVEQGVQQGVQQGVTQGVTQGTAQGAAFGSGVGDFTGKVATNFPGGASFGGAGVPVTENTFAASQIANQPTGIADWMGAGKGAGFAENLTNAQAYGAGAAGGIGGLYAAQNMPPQEQWPTESEPESPLSYFKYDPTKYRADQPTPSVYTARYADGGIANLSQTSPMSNTVYPQSQQMQTAFSSSPQYPSSMRSAMAADYDARTNPMYGTEIPPGYAGGGGIGFVRSMQPGGAFGDMTADLYGAQVNALPFLKDIEPGGFLGATTPGRMDYQDREQRKKDEEDARNRAAQEAAIRDAAIARNTSMQQGMAGGGIASLGGYSDGGRLLRGPGDGVSDSIPASIGGRQPARLADGEFVVPSRIVSELGNGSTDAGARRLYDMMDRVQARRSKTMGKGKVAKNTRAYQELPA